MDPGSALLHSLSGMTRRFPRMLRTNRDEFVPESRRCRRPSLIGPRHAPETGPLGLVLPGRAGAVLCGGALLSDARSLLDRHHQLEPADQALLHRAGQFPAADGRSGVLAGLPQHRALPAAGHADQPAARLHHRLSSRPRALPARLHPGAVFPAFPDDRCSDGLGLALVLPAGADRPVQQPARRGSASPSSPSCARPPNRCRPCLPPPSGPGSASRS